MGTLLAAGDSRAKAILNESRCGPLVRTPKPNADALEQLATCTMSGSVFSAAETALVVKRKQRAVERLEKIRAYVKREPTGFFDAPWGSSAMATAKEVLARLMPGPSMGWQLEQIRKAAKGVRLENGYMALTDKDGVQWFFSIDKENHLTGVIRRFPNSTLDTVLAQCESEYGAPVDRMDIGHDGTALAMMWSGSKGNVHCGRFLYGDEHFPGIETTATPVDDETK